MHNFRFHLFTCWLITVFLLYGGNVVKSNADSNDQVARITIEDVSTMLDKGEKILFIDTRNSTQWAKAKDKIPGAIRLNNNRDLADFASKYPANTAIVSYCT